MTPLMQVLTSVGVILICVAMFIGTYLLNKHTKKPEGCEEPGEGCAGCQIIGCSHHPDNNEKKEEKEK